MVSFEIDLCIGNYCFRLLPVSKCKEEGVKRVDAYYITGILVKEASRRNNWGTLGRPVILECGEVNRFFDGSFLYVTD